MKCPIAKCHKDDISIHFKHRISRCDEKDMNDSCDRQLARDLRRAQRLIREADMAMAFYGYPKEYKSWKLRAVEIGAMKESK